MKLISEPNVNYKHDIKINNKEIESIKSSHKEIKNNFNEPFGNIINIDKTDKDNRNNNFIIDNIYLADLFLSKFYCCCKRKRRYAYKILVNESMNIINEKLDIANIFKNICSIESSYAELNKNADIIKMSENCTKDLSEIKEIIK